MHSTGNSLVLCSASTYIERKSKKEGMYTYAWLIHFATQQKPTQQYRATILQLKKKKTYFAIFVNVNTGYIAFYGYYELQIK